MDGKLLITWFFWQFLGLRFAVNWCISSLHGFGLESYWSTSNITSYTKRLVTTLSKYALKNQVPFQILHKWTLHLFKYSPHEPHTFPNTSLKNPSLFQILPSRTLHLSKYSTHEPFTFPNTLIMNPAHFQLLKCCNFTNTLLMNPVHL